jgi:hypothetical protein
LGSTHRHALTTAFRVDAAVAIDISSEGMAVWITRAVINSMRTRTAAIAWLRRL